MERTLLICNGLLTVALILLAVAYHGAVDPKPMVYAMCQESRMYDTVHEETCGDLLDRYNLDYICQERSSTLENKCKLEEL
jgi:hypothetical protein